VAEHAVERPTSDEYLPAPHSVQAPTPLTVEYVPASHCVHVLEPAREYSPGTQVAEHAVERPTSDEYLPASHSVQAPTPLTVEYVPASHCVQVLEPAIEYLPGTQTSEHTVERPDVALYLPASQSTHAAEPVEIAYWPAGHAIHADDSDGEYEPTGQVSHTAEPGDEAYFPAAQAVQVPAPAVELLVGEALYIPTAQEMHEDEPAGAYFPAAHP
jgi:hypothetical protein